MFYINNIEYLFYVRYRIRWFSFILFIFYENKMFLVFNFYLRYKNIKV